ncbi:coniferyl-aldehyde dehydrogenase [Colwellia sp. 75C3]|uniref:coniferyl aldehyde dehydrogenase n=1 Tax=Colwellia sp. 75C3 TaxID=888425 RepID=UPI000C33C904|nr:coniferyl aldehyde dehydrogenase [Colwellia sp. 75C3]PKG82399.1 coniferyl-aldehyde dehydrogenase [Colwellia sp. 75C3]
MADNPYTECDDKEEIEQLERLFLLQKKNENCVEIPSAKQRISDIKALKNALTHHQNELLIAMSDDFGHRSKDDSKLGDILTTILSANYAIKHIKRWMRPSKRHVHPLFQPAKAHVQYQPLGVVGIITPWNYPIFLALGPLITALSAGNTAIIKMSEFTPNTNRIMKRLIASAFPPEKVTVICGGSSVAAHFTHLNFDHIVFTGSTAIGKKVMAAASENLTPVTLELGGKSPVIIGKDIDISTAVTRFLVAKTLNSGQTCVAPDYLLCPEEKIPKLIETLKIQFNSLYPNIENNPDYGGIINNAQFQRLHHLIEDASNKGGVITPLTVEKIDGNVRKMALTVITNIHDDMRVMQEEIFGPLLPIVPYNDIQQAIDYINQRENPLALYLMSFDKKTQHLVLNKTKAGGVCINEAAMHVAQDDLPFGGIGDSGMGQYHGREGFLALSKAKAVFSRGKFSLGSLIFPPYNQIIHKLIYKILIK